ncbi:MAG: hypothetical protein Q8K55_08380 [Gemmatimonadaceae bacterium]|nr:hypothetical protein [Gemmatimonadaceae bacterium]
MCAGHSADGTSCKRLVPPLGARLLGWRCVPRTMLGNLSIDRWYCAEHVPTRGKAARQVRCSKCGDAAPSQLFRPGVAIAGYAGFGRCQQCGKVWCRNCDAAVETSVAIRHQCPECREALSNDLFG